PGLLGGGERIRDRSPVPRVARVAEPLAEREERPADPGRADVEPGAVGGARDETARGAVRESARVGRSRHPVEVREEERDPGRARPRAFRRARGSTRARTGPRPSSRARARGTARGARARSARPPRTPLSSTHRALARRARARPRRAPGPRPERARRGRAPASLV